jgi:thioredoxin reductase (NADPH)
VAISCRHASFDDHRVKAWLLPELRNRIGAGEIEAHLATRPLAISPDSVTLQAEDGVTRDVPADDVLLLTGYVADPTLLRRAGVGLAGEERAPVHDPATMQTEVPGLYVAGTAIAGSQTSHAVFIENCHAHAARIAAHLAGRAVPEADVAPERPES